MSIDEIKTAVQSAQSADQVAQLYETACQGCREHTFRPAVLDELAALARGNSALDQEAHRNLEVRLPLIRYQAQCGTTVCEGEQYTLIQQIYSDMVAGMNAPYFAAVAVKDSEVLSPEQNPTKVKAYRLMWLVPEAVVTQWLDCQAQGRDLDDSFDQYFNEADDAEPYGIYDIIDGKWNESELGRMF